MDFKYFFFRFFTSLFLIFLLLIFIFYFEPYISFVFIFIYVIIFYEILFFFKNKKQRSFILFLYVFISLISIELYFIFFYEKILFLYFILLIICFDTFSYILGSLFGKKKIMPNISPNKTIFGFLGGLFSTFIILSHIFLLQLYSFTR